MFTSQKAALFDSSPMHDLSLPARPLFPPAGPVLRNVAAADGSVAHRSSASGIQGVAMPGIYRTGGQAQAGVVRMFDFTPFGVRGRDW
jgi:hypothetical protein